MTEVPGWNLEGFTGDRASSWRTAIRVSPFRVGRAEDCELQLDALGISSHHAEFLCSEQEVLLRDLGSTNGTFVNLQRVEGQRPCREGDAIHFADQEFRLVRSQATLGFRSTQALDMDAVRRAQRLIGRRPEVERLLAECRVTAMFQPVVRLADGQRTGFEMLGRGADSGLPDSPEQLFEVAEAVGLELPLARLMRRRGAELARDLPVGEHLFFNLHPSEIDRPEDLLQSIAGVRELLPSTQLVIEIHEMALTDIAAVTKFRDRLVDLDVELAFDDFGKGRSRLLELAELSPRFLKFDRALVRDLDRETGRRHEMIGRLVAMVRELGICALAEGLETEAEAEACRQLGFELAQGFLFGRPSAVESWAADRGLDG